MQIELCLSCLEALAKDKLLFCGKGVFTKKASQANGARIAIAKYSVSNNVSHLRHDLRSGPSHVFGDHSHCSVEFCTFCQSDTTLANDKSQNTPPTSDTAHANIEQQTDNNHGRN